MARILAIEEEIALVELYRRILEPSDFEVIGALNARQARDLLQRCRGRFVLVIIDLEIAKGRELVKKIHEDYPRIPILNCSLNEQEGLHLTERGICVGSVPKPFYLDIFTQAVLNGAHMAIERRSGHDRRVTQKGFGGWHAKDRRQRDRRQPLFPMLDTVPLEY
jgi:DNA-binding NtrC family response regulator